jgi:sodium/pantothenate symporter
MSWAWGLFLVYAVVTAWLAWRGGKSSGSGAGFAIGDGQMSPWVAGITLGACLASSATFVIVPGFVYAEGLPALAGFTLPFIAGIAAGLVLLSGPFQAWGQRFSALTVPHWLGERYGSPGLRKLFAGLNILNLAYLVLITVGCAYVMQAALGLPYAASVIGIVVFVFGYTGFGGATAHAFTNTLQGVVMLGVAVLIAASGYAVLGPATESILSSGWTAPESRLFSTPLEVWLVPALMGFALTTQPHLLAKSLYVKDRAAVRKMVAIAIACFAVFSLVLLAGAYARVVLPGDIAQDQVMAAYLVQAFPWKPLSALVTVAILAASMSTLDGLLVAIAASLGGDLFDTPSVKRNRVILALLALATIGLSLSPPKLVLILGQLGVYGLVVASAGPLLVGLFAKGRLPVLPALASAIAALVVHFGLALTVVDNPGVAASFALLVGLPVAALGALRSVSSVPSVVSPAPPELRSAK